MERGANIHTEVKLRSFEAEAGTRRVIGFHAIEPCPACLGRGAVAPADPCARCAGRGAVEARRRLRLRLPPGLEDCAQLRVSGEGNGTGADSVPGDLFVHVHVLPAPKDSRYVRYIASVLLLVAIAALALYLLL